MMKRTFAAAGVALALAAAPALAQDAQEENPTVATVNGTEITAADVAPIQQQFRE